VTREERVWFLVMSTSLGDMVRCRVLFGFMVEEVNFGFLNSKLWSTDITKRNELEAREEVSI